MITFSYSDAIQMGYSIIPIMNGKVPPKGFSWKQYQQMKPTEAEVALWINGYSPPYLAIVTGKISGVVAIDSDVPEGVSLVEKWGLNPHVRTPSGGYHIYFKHPDWHVPTLNSKTCTRLGSKCPGVDIRADGGYAVFYGNGYEWLRSTEPYNLNILNDEVRDYFSLLTPPSEQAPSTKDTNMEQHDVDVRTIKSTLLEKVREKLDQGNGRNNTGYWLACQLFYHHVSEKDAEIIMREYVELVPKTNTKGQAEAYTLNDAVKSLEQAYSGYRQDPWIPLANQHSNNRRTGMTAKELTETEFPPPNWIIPGILPEGLTILAGKAKIGKSWLVLHICVAVAQGGKVFGNISVEAREALYLALEDIHRRLKDRLLKVTTSNENLENLTFETEWPRSKQVGLDKLEERLKQNPNIKFIVIDTLGKFRAPAKGKNIYQEEYDALSDIKKIADTYSVSIVIVHHTRKEGSEDPFETISGTTGITGAVDTIMVLSKDNRFSNNLKLSITGRDVEEIEIALALNKENFSWALLGDATKHLRSNEQKEILDLISGNPGIIPEDIALRLIKSSSTVRGLLKKLRDANLIFFKKEGKYSHYYILDK